MKSEAEKLAQVQLKRYHLSEFWVKDLFTFSDNPFIIVSLYQVEHV